LVTINNLFDPGVSLSSTQPVYFDQLALIYNRYRCYGSRIKVIGNFQANTTGVGTTQMSSRLCVAPINGALSPTTIEDAIAQNFSKFTEVTPTKPGVISHAVTCAKLTGTHDVVGSDRFQAIISAAPSEVLNWSIAYINNVTQSAIDFHIEFQLTYDVEFFDRINLDRSTLSYQLMRKAVLARFAEARATENKRVKGAELPPLSAFEKADLETKSSADEPDYILAPRSLPQPERLSGAVPSRLVLGTKAELSATSAREPPTPTPLGGFGRR
jgi:hypothetical protein